MDCCHDKHLEVIKFTFTGALTFGAIWQFIWRTILCHSFQFFWFIGKLKNSFISLQQLLLLL